VQVPWHVEDVDASIDFLGLEIETISRLFVLVTST
jgi:hypothetical protein